jgi:flagellar biosynthesis GTPase FlhF
MPRNPKDRQPSKKKRPAPSDDDSSVDSEGNIRNLIDYDYDESEDEALFEMEDIGKKPRKAAAKAAKKISKIAKRTPALTESDTSDSDYKLPTKNKRPILVVESDSEDETEEELPKKAKKLKKKVVESDSEEEKPKKKRAKKVKVPESEEEESEESEEEEPVKKKKKYGKRVYESSSEEEEEEEEEDEEEDDDDEEVEESEEEEPVKKRGGRGGAGGAIDIVISDLFGGGGGRDPNKPQKYNLKKEPANVRRFVELVQMEDEGEEDTIDNDITYFKSLNKEKQASLISALEVKASPAEVQVPLKFKILEKVALKPELQRIAMAKYNALCNLDPASSEYYKCSHWITGFTGLPIGHFKDLPVKMEDGAEACHDFMGKVHKCMEKAIYGHDDAKLQILQFVSSWIANPKANGNVLSIHGPPGIGKTSIIKDGVAKALERPFHFISLGGATDASYLDGHSYTYEGSTWGRIVEILIQSKCMNPVIYFDELDKVSETPKGEEIMNLLIHLTDGSQNDRFQDKYFTGIDLDLSRCLFIFSHNNHEKVNPILRDRMYNIQCKGFSMKEKLLIAEEYLLPAALKESGLHEKISINKEILQYVVENYTGGEAGVRELKRCIQTIVSKVNLLRFYNNPKQVPFAIEGFSLPFTVKQKHVELFLKKKEDGMDESVRHLYV